MAAKSIPGRLIAKIAAKKTVKATEAEKKKVQAELRKKYPQMFRKGWGKARKKEPVYFKGITRKKTHSQQLRDAGLSEADIKRLGGR